MTMAVDPTMPGLRAVIAAGALACRENLIGFRAGLYCCLRKRADALFELVDAVLTAPGRVRSLVELSLAKAFRRGHGSRHDALTAGEVDVEALAGLLASSWDRPDAGPVKIAVDP